MNREATFTPTEADYVAANRAWLLYYLSSPKVRLLSIVLAACVLLILAGSVIAGDQQPLTYYLAGGFALLGGIQLLHWLLVPRRVRRMLRQRPSLLTPTRFVWDDQGLEATSDSGLTRVRWRELHRWFEGAHGFVFLLSDYMLLVFPARALSDGQAGDLRATALAHAPHAAKGSA